MKSVVKKMITRATPGRSLVVNKCVLKLSHLLGPLVFFCRSDFPESSAEDRSDLCRVDPSEVDFGGRVSLGQPLQVFGEGTGVGEVLDHPFHSAEQKHDQLLEVFIDPELTVTLVSRKEQRNTVLKQLYFEEC